MLHVVEIVAQRLQPCIVGFAAFVLRFECLDLGFERRLLLEPRIVFRPASDMFFVACSTLLSAGKSGMGTHGQLPGVGIVGTRQTTNAGTARNNATDKPTVIRNVLDIASNFSFQL